MTTAGADPAPPVRDGPVVDRPVLGGADRTALLELLVHDLRSPLTAIVGFADLLAERDETLSPQARRAAVEAVRRSGARLSLLLDGVAEVARLVGDGVPAAPPTHGVDLAAVAASVVAAGVGVADGVTVRVDGDLPLVRGGAAAVGVLLALLGTDGAERAGRPVELTLRPGDGGVDVVVDAEAGADPAGGGFRRHVVRLLLAHLGGRLAAEPGPAGGARLVAHVPAAGAPTAPP